MKALTAANLRDAIGYRYPQPEWHIESEFTLHRRRLDVVAFNLWGARGYRSVGFELKVSRGDWIRELTNFQKSTEWVAVVDEFYIVTPPKLISVEELPAGWGLLEFTGSRMLTKQQPEIRTNRQMPREIFARILSRTISRETAAEYQARYLASEQLRKEAEERVGGDLKREVENARAERDGLRTMYRELVDAIGLRPGEFRAHERALRAARVFSDAKGDQIALQRSLRASVTEMSAYVERLRQAAAAIDCT